MVFNGLLTPPQSPVDSITYDELESQWPSRILGILSFKLVKHVHKRDLDIGRFQGDELASPASSATQWTPGHHLPLNSVAERTDVKCPGVRQKSRHEGAVSSRSAIRRGGIRNSKVIRSPDRFVPSKGSAEIANQTFHSNKAPQQLNSTERLLRNDLPVPDAFIPRQTPSHITLRAPSARRRSSMVRVGQPTPVPMFREGASDTSTTRQVRATKYHFRLLHATDVVSLA